MLKNNQLKIEEKFWRVPLFGGNLYELRDFTGYDYEIADDYFRSDTVNIKYLEAGCRQNLIDEGYDGLIHRMDHMSMAPILHHFFYTGSGYMTGVPVRKVVEKEEENLY
jgi:hypothetical protein